VEEQRKRSQIDLQPIAYLLFSAIPLIFTPWFFSTNHKDIGTLYIGSRLLWSLWDSRFL